MLNRVLSFRTQGWFLPIVVLAAHALSGMAGLSGFPTPVMGQALSGNLAPFADLPAVVTPELHTVKGVTDTIPSGRALTREGSYLYRIARVRAAPGRFRAAIAAFKELFDLVADRGDERPFWMRHSQGDTWDFLIFYPMEDYASYYGEERLLRIASTDSDFSRLKAQLDPLVARTEDLFVRGVDVDSLRRAFGFGKFFHIEMFQALPGKRAELIEQRRMENRYLATLNRPENYIFVRDAGISVDAFTLGIYRDIAHFAESGDIPFETEDQAARDAGFDGVGAISPYLRSLILKHHDTLAVAID